MSSKKESRTKKTIRNSAFGFGSKILMLLFAFITRKVFISALGNEYLAINGLFTNILSILSLAELGFGSAILFHFYKPIAENDKERVKTLMHVYKKIYKAIGFIVFFAGLCVIPFLNKIIVDKPNITENLYVIYVLYVANSALTYLWIYKKSILVADQKEYIATKTITFMNFVSMIGQIIALYVTNNFIVYFLVGVVINLATNFWISRKTDKLYPYITQKGHVPLDKDTKKRIIEDVKAVLVYKVGGVLTVGLDNIIITRFVGLGWVGILSNYDLISAGVASLLNSVVVAATGSVGNINTSDDKDQQDRVYRLLLFVSFWLYGFSAIAYFTLANPFILLWFGEKFILDPTIVAVIALNAYFMGVQMPTILFRNTLGLYKYGKLRPIMGAIINLIISLVFVKYLGVLGVLLGTLGSRILAMTWYEPRVNYKYGIHKSPKKFFLEYVFYLVIMLFAGGITYWLNQFIIGDSIGIFILRVGLVLVVTNVIFLILAHRMSHFKFLLNYLRKFVSTKFKGEKNG